MKIVLIAVAAALLLSGCEPSQKQVNYPVLPEELKDCKFFYIYNGSRDMQVVRCPNSITSVHYKEGKANRQTVTIDGVEYVKK